MTQLFFNLTQSAGNPLPAIHNESSTSNTLYAVWASAWSLTVQYDLNGGSAASGESVYYETSYEDQDDQGNNSYPDEIVKTVASKTPVKNGYEFTGWLGSDNKTYAKDVAVAFDINGKTHITFTLTAQWQIINYDISYDLDGGTAENPSSYTVEDGFTLNNPTQDGYVFTGWIGSNGDTAQTAVSIATGTTGALSYTAQWELDTTKTTDTDDDVDDGDDVDDVDDADETEDSTTAETSSSSGSSGSGVTVTTVEIEETTTETTPAAAAPVVAAAEETSDTETPAAEVQQASTSEIGVDAVPLAVSDMLDIGAEEIPLVSLAMVLIALIQMAIALKVRKNEDARENSLFP